MQNQDDIVHLSYLHFWKDMFFKIIPPALRSVCRKEWVGEGSHMLFCALLMCHLSQTLKWKHAQQLLGHSSQPGPQAPALAPTPNKETETASSPQVREGADPSGRAKGENEQQVATEHVDEAQNEIDRLHEQASRFWK